MPDPVIYLLVLDLFYDIDLTPQEIRLPFRMPSPPENGDPEVKQGDATLEALLGLRTGMPLQVAIGDNHVLGCGNNRFDI